MDIKDTESHFSDSEQQETFQKIKDVEWSVDHENILVEWADKAMCYRWLHGKANSLFSRKNTWYTIPVIVISTLTGTANFAQDRVPSHYQSLFVMTVGAFNILAGIITTVQQFLKITQLNEAHRVSSIAWDKFYRNIKTELAKHPSERLPVIQFLKMCKEEFDRLMETSPVIPEDIIELFNNQFSDKKVMEKMITDKANEGFTIENGCLIDENGNKQDHHMMQVFSKPEICDSLVSTNSSRNPWYTEEMQLKEKSKQMRDNMSKISETKRQHAYNIATVNNFKKNFYNLNNREPLTNEIIDNLREQMNEETIKSIIFEIDKNRKSDNISRSTSSDNNNNIFGEESV